MTDDGLSNEEDQKIREIAERHKETLEMLAKDDECDYHNKIWRCPRCGSLDVAEHMCRVYTISDDALDLDLMMWCLTCSWTYHVRMKFKLADAESVEVKE